MKSKDICSTTNGDSRTIKQPGRFFRFRDARHWIEKNSKYVPRTGDFSKTGGMITTPQLVKFEEMAKKWHDFGIIYLACKCLKKMEFIPLKTVT